MVKYELVNPSILGQFNSTYEVTSSMDAAKQFWNDLSPHLTNNLPFMYITLKEQTGGLHHFKIKEKISEGSKLANYSIKEVKLNLTKKQEMDFLNKVEKTKTKKNSQIQSQLGGKSGRKRYDGKKDSSESLSSSSKSISKSSDSDDSSDDDDDAYFNFTRYKRMNQPIVYWNYIPTIYRVTRFFTPTFNVPLMPYIHIYNPKL
jgi:hypothetical protein